MFRLTSSLLCGLSISLAACGGSQQASEKLEVDITETDPKSDSDVSVQVISHAFRDANIYIFLGSSKHRLGIARGKQTTVFTIPWARFAQVNDARLSADPIGMNVDVGSDRFTVQPGNTVVWTLETQAGEFGEFEEARGQSNVTVY